MKTPRLKFVLLIAALLVPVVVQAGRSSTAGVATQVRPRVTFGTPAMARNRTHALAPAVIGGPAKSRAALAAKVDGTDVGHRH